MMIISIDELCGKLELMKKYEDSYLEVKSIRESYGGAMIVFETSKDHPVDLIGNTEVYSTPLLILFLDEKDVIDELSNKMLEEMNLEELKGAQIDFGDTKH